MRDQGEYNALSFSRTFGRRRDVGITRQDVGRCAFALLDVFVFSFTCFILSFLVFGARVR